jgi:hypothetical protein
MSVFPTCIGMMEGKSLKQVKQKIDTVCSQYTHLDIPEHVLIIVRVHNMGESSVRLCTYSDHQLYLHTRTSAVVSLARSWIL